MNQRFYSLDVFRGATVALMILVNNPGNWSNLYAPLSHAGWHGCTPTDLVFPFFLFAVGNALAFVMPRLEAAGRSAFLKKVITRSLLIFAIGLFLNWFPFVKWSNDQLVFKHWVDPGNPENGIRLLGVLQRIALCYLFASLIIYFFRLRGAYVAAIVILLGYWALCFLLGNPADPYSLNGYFGTRLDKDLLGIAHLYKGEGVPFDPEGIASTLTGIAQVIFGYFAGHYIRQKGTTYEMLSNLFVIGGLLILTGLAWGQVFPINKKIWTSSYVLYTTGIAILVLSTLLFLVEFKQVRGSWTRFFNVFGKNALFIFMISVLVPRSLGLLRFVDHTSPEGEKIYTTPLPWFYNHVCAPLFANAKTSSLLYAVCMVIFFWLIVYWMDRKKIYIKV